MACAQPGVDAIAGGVGPAESAAATALALVSGSYDLVLSAGIGGGFAGLQPGDIAVADEIVFADLGAETADGFAPVSQLGFGGERYPVQAAVLARLRGTVGTILTVATVTGTAATATALTSRYPRAVAEGMEGAGVAAAARQAGVAYGEIRAVSNLVGPRDRAAWRIGDALAALHAAIGDLV